MNKIKKYAPIIILFIGIVSGLFWGTKYHNYGQLIKDEAEYDTLARNILSYHTFGYSAAEPTMQREPGYPAFLVIIYYIFGHKPLVVLFFQILLFTATAFIIYRIGALLLNGTIGLLAGILSALFPTTASFVGYMGTETLFTFLFVLWIYIFAKAIKYNKWYQYFLAGIIFGLAVLTRTIILYILPFIIFIPFIIYRHKFKQAMLVAMLFLVACFLIITPWAIRNKYDFNTYSLRGNGGWLLWIRTETVNLSFREYGQYISTAIFGDYITQKICPDFSGDFRSLTYLPSKDRINELAVLKYTRDESDAIMMNEAKLNILSHPFLYGLGSIAELFKLQTPMNPQFQTFHMFVETNQNMPSTIKIFIILFIRTLYLLFFSSVFYGIYKAFRAGGIIAVIGLAAVLFELVYTLVDTIPRYLLPDWPLYFIFFIHGLSFMFPRQYKTMQLILE